jgi:hypothetical protein
MDKKITELKGDMNRKISELEGRMGERFSVVGEGLERLSGRVEGLGSAFTGYQEFLLSFWLVRGLLVGIREA